MAKYVTRVKAPVGRRCRECMQQSPDNHFSTCSYSWLTSAEIKSRTNPTYCLHNGNPIDPSVPCVECDVHIAKHKYAGRAALVQEKIDAMKQRVESFKEAKKKLEEP